MLVRSVVGWVGLTALHGCHAAIDEESGPSAVGEPDPSYQPVILRDEVLVVNTQQAFEGRFDELGLALETRDAEVGTGSGGS